MSAPPAPGFESAVARLEHIVRELERDDLPLDDALALFEEGVVHVRTATQALARADARVGQLVEQVDGALVVEPVGEG
jgi:exodeoxyribonuclease VII small subunit